MTIARIAGSIAGVERSAPNRYKRSRRLRVTPPGGPQVESALDLPDRSEGGARLIGAIYLCAALPELGRDVLAWRVRWCLFGVLGALLSDATAPFAKQPDALIRDLTAVSAAALAAPHRD